VNNPWETLTSALAGIPELDGAICAGDKSGIWDADTADDAHLAIRACLRCPALAECRAWARSQPRNSIHGVIGAERYVWIQNPIRRQPRKSLELTG
jgi:hypothetical protein